MPAVIWGLCISHSHTHKAICGVYILHDSENMSHIVTGKAALIDPFGHLRWLRPFWELEGLSTSLRIKHLRGYKESRTNNDHYPWGLLYVFQRILKAYEFQNGKGQIGSLIWQMVWSWGAEIV